MHFLLNLGHFKKWIGSKWLPFWIGSQCWSILNWKHSTVLCSYNRNQFTFVDIWKFPNSYLHIGSCYYQYIMYTLQTTFSVTKIMSKKIKQKFYHSFYGNLKGIKLKWLMEGLRIYYTTPHIGLMFLHFDWIAWNWVEIAYLTNFPIVELLKYVQFYK